MESKSSVTTAVVTLVVGLLVGGGVGYAVSNMNMNDSMDSSMSNSGDSSMQMSSSSDGVTVGGAKMVRDKDIVDNAVNAKNVSTLVSLVKKADLVDTLKGDGPFTVFAPNNDAFSKLPKATVEDLQKPANKKMLQTILTDHVVAGTYTSADLKVMADKGETLKTVGGAVLKPVMKDNKLMIQDEKGDDVMIQTSDVISSNGVTHVVESVLMPKS